MANHLGPKIVTDRLAYCIDPGNPSSYTSGSSTLYDISRNEYTGSFQGEFVYPSSTPYALQYDGISDCISLGTRTPNLYPTTDSYTWTGWLKYASHSGQIWYGNAGGGNDGFGILLSSGQLRVEVMGTSGTPIRQQSYATMTPYFNIWHQLTVVLDRTGFTSTIYANGTQISQTVLTDWGIARQEPSAGVNGIYIGTYNGTGASIGWYSGLMGTIHIYRKALSATEVLQNYNATKGRYI